MKSVLISIQPRWCELIASGKKTVEVRKSKPKIDVPFKCYIYCTKDKHGWFDFLNKTRRDGKVIGEFVCDDINNTDIVHGDEEVGWYVNNMHAVKGSGLDEHDILCYCLKETTIYGWHISDLVIYDKPRELSEFRYYNPIVKLEGGYPIPIHEIERPPQSWCYVETDGGSDA